MVGGQSLLECYLPEDSHINPSPCIPLPFGRGEGREFVKRGVFKRGEAHLMKSPQSPFAKEGEVLPLRKGEREGFYQGEEAPGDRVT